MRIFVSYRRRDTQHIAGRLRDWLERRFTPAQIFMDVVSIAPGVDFAEVIKRAVGDCDVMLVLIGPGWLTATDSDGRRLLDNPGDFVRLEVKTALARGIRVIPVLVDGAVIPRRDALPASLRKLPRRNAFTMAHVTFERDADALVRALGQVPTDQAPHLIVPRAASSRWKISNLPPRNRHFTGRAGLLERLHQDLAGDGSAAVVQARTVHGLGAWARASSLWNTPTGMQPTMTWPGGSLPSSR